MNDREQVERGKGWILEEDRGLEQLMPREPLGVIHVPETSCLDTFSLAPHYTALATLWPPFFLPPVLDALNA